MANPEFRLIAGSGQDRSANLQCARTTDKGLENLGIYSLLSRHNNLKRELTQGTPFVQPTNQDARTAKILLACCLATGNRRKLAKMTGVTA